MNNTAYRPPPVRHHHIRTWGRRPRLPNGSVLAGTPSHRPSAPPRAPAGARSKRGPRRSGPGHAVLTRRRLGHPDPAGDQPDAVPLGTPARPPARLGKGTLSGVGTQSGWTRHLEYVSQKRPFLRQLLICLPGQPRTRGDLSQEPSQKEYLKSSLG